MASKRTGKLVLVTLGLGALALLGTGFAHSEQPFEPEPDPEPDPNLDPFTWPPEDPDEPDPDEPDPDEPEPEPEDPDPDNPGEPGIFLPGVLDDPDEPDAPDEPPLDLPAFEHPENYPSPGVFHQVEQGDVFFGTGSRHNVAWAVLYEAAYQAARQVGNLSDSQARTFASSLAGKGSNRVKYTDLILCCPWNDLLYGTWGYGKQSHPGPHGRSIRLLPMHPDNRSLLMQGSEPVRNIRMRTPADKRKGNAGPIDPEWADGHEYLWLPPLNLVRLWQNGQITTEGLTWDDGSSKMLPPPEVWNRGVHALEDPQLAAYGCLGAEMEME